MSMLIAVDENDVAVGSASRDECHRPPGIRHRAFSILLFDIEGNVLIQQRSAEKELWPLVWSNACCSHPRFGEGLDDAVTRRLEEELSIQSATTFLYEFEYASKYRDVGIEWEICHVYVGVCHSPIIPDPGEVADARFMHPAELDEAMAREPEQFTPWFRKEWAAIRERHWPQVLACIGDSSNSMPWSRVRQWWRASRISKNVAIPLLPIAGCAMAPAPSLDSSGGLLTALAFFAAIWTTHLNTWSDRSMDESRQPEHLVALRGGCRSTTGLLLAEGALMISGLLVLSISNPGPAAAMGAAALMAALYSHVPGIANASTAYGLKHHWFTHAASFLIGYVALWLSGFLLGQGVLDLRMLAVFLALSASEYSLYLAESSADASEEANAGLRSLAACYGVTVTSTVAIGIAILSMAAIMELTRSQPAIAISLLAGASLRMLGMLRVVHGVLRSRDLREYAGTKRFADGTFILARVVTTIGLVMTHWAAPANRMHP